MDPVRGRQVRARSQQDVWDVSIRFAARRTGVQKGQTLPLRVWVSRRQVDGGWIEGALGLGCRSRAPHGVPRTEPSAPCCVAADPELLIECGGQSVR